MSSIFFRLVIAIVCQTIRSFTNYFFAIFFCIHNLYICWSTEDEKKNGFHCSTKIYTQRKAFFVQWKSVLWPGGWKRLKWSRLLHFFSLKNVIMAKLSFFFILLKNDIVGYKKGIIKTNIAYRIWRVTFFLRGLSSSTQGWRCSRKYRTLSGGWGRIYTYNKLCACMMLWYCYCFTAALL